LLICISQIGYAQVQAQIKISAIEITGNKKTRAYVILRELPYKVGDSISRDSLVILNTIAQQQLVNTALFLEVKVNESELDSTNVTINVQLKERWYFFPLPYFRWVDRNFNQWWNEQNRSLDRVNYGINLRQGNVSGNNDKLTVGLISGYTQQSVVKYQIPFIDKKLKFGMGVGWAQFNQKEVNYTTLNNKQVFLRTEEVIRKGYRANANLTYRPNLYERQAVQIGFGNESISDSAFAIAPNFLPNHKKAFSYLDFNWSYSKVRFDYNAYPTKGASTEIALFQRFSKESNLSAIQFRQVVAHPITPARFILAESLTIGRTMQQSNYSDRKLMGYGLMQMNGLEYYVVDGNAATLFKAAFHQRIGSYTVTNPLTKKFFPSVKYTFWIKAFTNLGYVYSEEKNKANPLANSLLRTAGIGLDLISIYDFVLNMEYSINQLGDKGLYLHGGINF
jgi:outer membrane protein assembly factor BamA